MRCFLFTAQVLYLYRREIFEIFLDIIFSNMLQTGRNSEGFPASLTFQDISNMPESADWAGWK